MMENGDRSLGGMGWLCESEINRYPLLNTEPFLYYSILMQWELGREMINCLLFLETEMS